MEELVDEDPVEEYVVKVVLVQADESRQLVDEVARWSGESPRGDSED